MNRIDKKFKRLKKENAKAFIAYITAGYPSLRFTEKLVEGFDKCGVDVVELGVPFSDPMADGPTIQYSSSEALKNGINISKILKMVRRLRNKGIKVPLVLMTYYNPVHRYGVKRFTVDSNESGADGAIVPDLPFEEARDLSASAAQAGFDIIYLAAPTSTRKRLANIAKRSKGFIYYVSVTGITGARRALPKDIKSHIGALKKITDKPICVGFGVSNKKQAADMARIADGVIVGSAVIKKIKDSINKKDSIGSVVMFVKNLLKGVKGA